MIVLHISTHTLTWSVTLINLMKQAGITFQLTRSRGAWPSLLDTLHYPLHFNSHAHVERDETFTETFARTKHFNSHAHVERDPCVRHTQQPQPHFNSHAHVERDLTTAQALINPLISTHTLTWSVTLGLVFGLYRKHISTHTLTWSVTYYDIICMNRQIFQLTRSRGAWHRWLNIIIKI